MEIFATNNYKLSIEELRCLRNGSIFHWEHHSKDICREIPKALCIQVTNLHNIAGKILKATNVATANDRFPMNQTRETVRENKQPPASLTSSLISLCVFTSIYQHYAIS